MNTIVSDARRIASPEAAQEFAHAQKLPIDDAMIAAKTGGHLRRTACGRSSAPVPCGWRLLGPESPGGGAVDVAVQWMWRCNGFAGTILSADPRTVVAVDFIASFWPDHDDSVLRLPRRTQPA